MDGHTDALGDPGRATARAHRTLRMHLPRRDWCWLGLRLRCRYCGQRYPCPPRRVALRHLEPGDRPGRGGRNPAGT